MLSSALVAALHFLGFGAAFGSVVARGIFLRASPLSDLDRGRAFKADGVWGLAFLVLLPTGLFRAFGGLEKGTDFYLHSGAWMAKMTVLLVILALEIWPMITLLKWRIAVNRKKAQGLDMSRAKTFSTISFVEAALVVVMVVLASLMAHGLLQMS